MEFTLPRGVSGRVRFPFFFYDFFIDCNHGFTVRAFHSAGFINMASISSQPLIRLSNAEFPETEINPYPRWKASWGPGFSLPFRTQFDIPDLAARLDHNRLNANREHAFFSLHDGIGVQAHSSTLH